MDGENRPFSLKTKINRKNPKGGRETLDIQQRYTMMPQLQISPTPKITKKRRRNRNAKEPSAACARSPRRAPRGGPRIGPASPRVRPTTSGRARRAWERPLATPVLIGFVRAPAPSCFAYHKPYTCRPRQMCANSADPSRLDGNPFISASARAQQGGETFISSVIFSGIQQSILSCGSKF